MYHVYMVGVVQVSTLDGRLLHMVDTGQGLNSVTATPESFGSASDDGFTSKFTKF